MCADAVRSCSDTGRCREDMGGDLDELDYSALNPHAGVHAGAVAAWLRAPSTDPVWVHNVCRFQLDERVGVCMGTRMRGTRGELLNCLGALSLVIPCLSCPPFCLRTGDHYLCVCTDLLKIYCVPTTRPRARPLTVCGGAYESEIFVGGLSILAVYF